MLERPGHQLGGVNGAHLTMAIEAFEHRALRTRNRRVEPGNAQAAFFFELHPVALDEHRIDEYLQLVGIVTERKIDDEDA